MNEMNKYIPSVQVFVTIENKYIRDKNIKLLTALTPLFSCVDNISRAFINNFPKAQIENSIFLPSPDCLVTPDSFETIMSGECEIGQKYKALEALMNNMSVEFERPVKDLHSYMFNHSKREDFKPSDADKALNNLNIKKVKSVIYGLKKNNRSVFIDKEVKSSYEYIFNPKPTMTICQEGLRIKTRVGLLAALYFNEWVDKLDSFPEIKLDLLKWWQETVLLPYGISEQCFKLNYSRLQRAMENLIASAKAKNITGAIEVKINIDNNPIKYAPFTSNQSLSLRFSDTDAVIYQRYYSNAPSIQYNFEDKQLNYVPSPALVKEDSFCVTNDTVLFNSQDHDDKMLPLEMTLMLNIDEVIHQLIEQKVMIDNSHLTDS